MTSDANAQAIRESFGRVVYSHKTHEKARELASSRSDLIKRANIFLTALTSGSLLGAVISNERVLLFVTSGLSAITLGFMIFQLSFNPDLEAERHRAVAKELWHIRERYIHLLADLKVSPDRVDVERRRDELIAELNVIYKLAPDTSSEAYLAAQRALKVSEDMTFSSEEIDRFLPSGLHEGRGVPGK